MRFVACLMIISLMFYSCKKGEIKRIPVKSEWKGKVKTVKTGTDYFYKVHHFDTAGNDTAIYTYGNNNKLITKATYKYDSIHYLLSSESFNTSNNIVYYTTCTYSEDWTERTEKYSSSHVAVKYDDRQFVQDTKGNLLAEYVLKGDTKVFMTRNTYDTTHNFLIMSEQFSEGYTVTYTNDDHGNPVIAKYNYPKEKRSDTKNIVYVYDSRGNWIEKTEKSDLSNSEIKEKSVIEYY